MIGQAIAFLLRNLPAVMLVLALILGATGRPRGPAASRFLGWVLLLPIGVVGLWAGIAHLAFPQVAAGYIGWQASPFQFEVGMADLAVGITACLAFWRPWEFRAAVCAAAIFLLGDAVGHVRQMIGAGDFAPGNAGLPFSMDVIAPALAIGFLLASRGSERPADERDCPVRAFGTRRPQPPCARRRCAGAPRSGPEHCPIALQARTARM